MEREGQIWVSIGRPERDGGKKSLKQEIKCRDDVGGGAGGQVRSGQGKRKEPVVLCVQG